MKKTIQLFLFTMLFSFSTNAQQIVSSEYLDNITAAELTADYFISFPNGVDLYRILYTTNDIQGQPDTASGLLAIPDDPNFVYPLLCYQHGTVNSRWDVPSQLAGGYQLAAAFGGQGFAVVAPDFLGLGEARGLHPYVHAETEASAAVDMLFAARQFADENDFLSLNDQLFITGYSQGGHAAFAAHKYIEEHNVNDFTVTASSPMSGPYSISERMIDFTLGDEEYGFVAYIVWTYLSYDLASGNTLASDVSEVFKAPYIPYIQQFENEEITLAELNAALISTLIAENGVGQSKPKLMIQDDILDAILNDPTHPFSMALAENDLVDWMPVAPTQLVGCAADDQVAFQNAIYTSQVMAGNGLDVPAIDVNSDADHGDCVFPATLNTLAFFQGFQNIGTINNTKEPLIGNALLDIQPNPATDYINIKLSALANSSKKYQLSLFNSNGKMLNQMELSGREVQTVSTAHLPAGIYLVKTVGEEGSYTQKVLVR